MRVAASSLARAESRASPQSPSDAITSAGMAAGAALTRIAAHGRCCAGEPVTRTLVPGAAGVVGGEGAGGSEDVRSVPAGFIYRPADRSRAARIPAATAQVR